MKCLLPLLLVLFIAGCSSDCAVNNQEFQQAAKDLMTEINQVKTDNSNLNIQLEGCAANTTTLVNMTTLELVNKCQEFNLINQSINYTIVNSTLQSNSSYIRRIASLESSLEDCWNSDFEKDYKDLYRVCVDDRDDLRNETDNCEDECEEDKDEIREDLNTCEDSLDDCEEDLDAC